MRRAVVAWALAASVLCAPNVGAGAVVPVRAVAKARAVVCMDDEWCWNAFLMGNHGGHYSVGQERPVT